MSFPLPTYTRRNAFKFGGGLTPVVVQMKRLARATLLNPSIARRQLLRTHDLRQLPTRSNFGPDPCRLQHKHQGHWLHTNRFLRYCRDHRALHPTDLAKNPFLDRQSPTQATQAAQGFQNHAEKKKEGEGFADLSSYEGPASFGSAEAPKAPNKSDQLIRRIAATLTVDPPGPEVTPNSDADQERSAAELAERILKVEGSPAERDDASLLRELTMVRSAAGAPHATSVRRYFTPPLWTLPYSAY